MTDISVIGLGAMGSALAQCLLAHGHAVTVWNRTPDKAAPLVAAGARQADTLEQAVLASPLVLTCIKTHGETRQLLDPLGDALSGKTVLELSTGDAADADRLVAALSDHGADYMIGMVNAYPSGIGKAETTILTVSTDATWDRFGDIVRQLGGGSTRIGAEPSALAAMFAALFTIRQGFMFGMIYAGLVCQKAGVPMQALVDQIQVSIGMQQNYYSVFAKTVPTGDYDDPEASMATYAAALDDALATFKSTGAPAALPQLMSDLTHDAMRDGYADKQLTALVEQMLKDS